MIDITDQKALDAALEEFRKSWDDQERKEFEEATSVESIKPTVDPKIGIRIHRLLMENEKRCDEKRAWDSAVGVMVKSEED